MNWTDDGVVLAAEPHGETSLVLRVLTRHHGKRAGRVRGGRAARGRAAFEPGTLVAASWRGRLEEQLGHLECEALRPFAAAVLEDPLRLAALAGIVAVADATLPDREPHEDVFLALVELLAMLEVDTEWGRAAVAWEVALLAALGFGLDLGRCALTGATRGLAYVSPKTGRAITEDAAGIWRERLLPLPAFLVEDAPAGPGDVAAGLALTGYFLERHALAEGRRLPAARLRLYDALALRAVGVSGLATPDRVD